MLVGLGLQFQGDLRQKVTCQQDWEEGREQRW